MDFNFRDTYHLLQRAQEERLYESLIAQLQKDFGLANIDIHLDHITDELNIVLREKIYYLLLEKFDAYLNLLYIIDVPEKEFKHITMTDAVDVAEQISHLVLKREFQKVWFKQKYTS